MAAPDGLMPLPTHPFEHAPQGWNARGTLGHGHRETQGKPQRVAGLEAVQIRQAAIGGWHVLALDSTGQCWAWGECSLLQH